MANRAADWLRQARADIKHATDAATSGSFEWCCFASQQAAEKAIKVGKRVRVPDKLTFAARILDKHYIPTRSPNGFDSGAPTDYYTREEAAAAIEHARDIIGFCENLLH